MILNIAVFAPMPSASVRTATSVKPGDLPSWRKANLRSFMSFSAQCLNGIDMRRAARRNQTSEQCRERQHDRGRAKQQRIVGRNLVKLRGQQATDGKSSGQTNNQTEDDRTHPLPHDEAQYVPRLRTERHAHTNFASALFDGVSDSTVDSNHSKEHGDTGEHTQ